MELKQPAQYYWTTLVDPYQPQSLSFAFIPSRSFPNNEIPRLEIIRDALHADTMPMAQIQAWHLPLLLASLRYGRAGYGPVSPIDRLSQLSFGGPITVQPHELGFAEYVAYSDVIPFEESPLKGKSLMSIAASAGVTIGVMAAGGTPFVILTVPLGILFCTAAAELGPELGRALPRLIGLK